MFRRNCLDSIDSKRRKNCNRFFFPNIIRQQKKIQYRIFFLYCKYFCRQYFSARHSRFDYINHLTEKINNLTKTSFGSMKFFRIFYFELKHWSMWPVDFFRLNFILQLCCNNNNEVQVRTAHGCKLLYQGHFGQFELFLISRRHTILTKNEGVFFCVDAMKRNLYTARP